MTVRELLDLLVKMPPDRTVVVRDLHTEYNEDVEKVTQVEEDFGGEEVVAICYRSA